MPGVRLLAFDPAPTAEDVTDWPGEWDPASTVGDLARAIAATDVLISVDTLAAHLAGALGVPVWTLLNHDPDWRWMLDRADSPWYPTHAPVPTAGARRVAGGDRARPGRALDGGHMARPRRARVTVTARGQPRPRRHRRVGRRPAGARRDPRRRSRPSLPAAVVVVVHTRSTSGVLPQVLRPAQRLPVETATDGAALVPGTVYVAPADRHVLVGSGGLRVVRGPRENGFRPAIDPLFRTAARTARAPPSSA